MCVHASFILKVGRPETKLSPQGGSYTRVAVQILKKKSKVMIYINMVGPPPNPRNSRGWGKWVRKNRIFGPTSCYKISIKRYFLDVIPIFVISPNCWTAVVVSVEINGPIRIIERKVEKIEKIRRWGDKNTFSTAIQNQKQLPNNHGKMHFYPPKMIIFTFIRFPMSDHPFGLTVKGMTLNQEALCSNLGADTSW